MYNNRIFLENKNYQQESAILLPSETHGGIFFRSLKTYQFIFMILKILKNFKVKT